MAMQRSDISHSKPWITPHDRRAVETAMQSGIIAEGELVRRFEEGLSSYLALEGGIATCDGTHALFLALMALGVSSGDEVIIPTYVCSSVWHAVAWTGATPVLCDVGDNWCMNMQTVRHVCTSRTKAIVAVHVFGITADVPSMILSGIPVIEDCCQALGCEHGENAPGTAGPLCVCSFHATKLLTTGEGGMVLTGDRKLLRKLRALKFGGSNGLEFRSRSPMSDIQAALGLSQLSRYEDSLRRRSEIADYYFEGIDEDHARLPHHIRSRSIFYRFPLLVKQPHCLLRAAFSREGVQVRRGVDILLHRELGLRPDDFPGAEQCFAETLSIPIYPALTEQERHIVADVANRIFTQTANSQGARNGQSGQEVGHPTV